MLESQSFAVLGLARSGIAAAYKVKELNGIAYLSDSQPRGKFPNADELENNFQCEFGGHSDELLKYPVWIVSPGIPLSAPIIQSALKHKIKLISELEFGFQVKSKDSKVIAVTGSNGKSTTVTEIHHILKNMGYNSVLAGNIGSAFCSHPIQKPGIDFIVLEVSSFQLDLIDTFKPDVAVLLNITPDHLNRYESYQHYIDSKFRIFENQTPEQTAVICIDSVPVIAHEGSIKSHVLRYSTEKKTPECDAWLHKEFIQIGLRHRLNVSELKVKGIHNFANTMAALLSVESVTHDLDFAMQAAKTFQPLEHRLEYVTSIKGVLFYNDSKATNTDSVKCALTSFDKPIRVIMGGSEKNEDYSNLTPLLKQWAKKVYITGDTRDKMKAAWEDSVDLVCIDDFDETIRTAFQESQPGDIVVLSPACASFDRFRNYEHRGEYFKELVYNLAAEYEEK